MTDLRTTIEAAAAEDGGWRSDEARAAVDEVIALLDAGDLRVAEKVDGAWLVNDWVQQAIGMRFPQAEMSTIEVGPFEYHDKLPLKTDYAGKGVRVVPPATARFGAFIESGAILRPSYVNIGAWVGSGTMVDTWATVGSGAQIGRGVHLSGGVGIGGVLEPPGARPVIVEDHCFIGSRAVIVEGCWLEEGVVIGSNVVLTRSTPIIDVTGDEPVEYRGHVPARSVVIPGSRVKDFPAGSYHVPCALIIGQRKASTDEKTSLNEALRDHDVQV